MKTLHPCWLAIARSFRSGGSRRGLRVAAVVAGLVGWGMGSRVAWATPWEEMDYGPFLTASIGVPSVGGATNIAYKGVAVDVGRAAGAPGRGAVVFDTDLLRYAAGWSGGFVALKGVVFDGEHWAYPLIGGTPAFANRMGPGWARPGTQDFADPREQPYGPMSRDWARWEGLHLHGSRVVFRYRVGEMPVLESPGWEGAEGGGAYVRTLNLGPSAVAQTVQLLEEMGRRPVLGRSGDGAGAVGVEGSWVWLEAPMIKGGAAKVMAPAEDGLIGHWSFDGEDASAVEDRSPAKRRLVLRGAVRTDRGRFGGGLETGEGRYAEIPGAEAIDFGRMDLTVAAWVRTREDGVVFTKAAPAGEWVPGGVALFVRGGRLTVDVGWVGAVASGRAIADGEWHHVAATFAAVDGTVTLYVDGKADGTGKLKPGATPSVHGARWGLGASNFPAAPWWRGTMDDLRVYGRVLGPVEVEALVGPPRRDTTVPAVAVLGAPAGARWVLVEETGAVRFEIPAHEGPVRLKFLLWRGDEGRLGEFGRWAGGQAGPEDLEPLTRGGPGRWGSRLETTIRPGGTEGPYAIDELPAPETNPWKSWMRFGGLDFFADGRRAAVSTWNGDVWVVTGVDAVGAGRVSWQRVATGLFQPLGVKVVGEEIYVLGRDQITRLHDRDGDGEADFYENFNNDALVSEHFHEFATDLKLGPDGDFYYIKCARHALPAAHAQHGSLIRVSRDGRRSEVVARGFRAVNGLGVGPNGEFMTIDNQGHWMPANRLNWVKPGGWYGNQWAWNPEARTTYDEPLCWMHNFVDRSGGTQLPVADDRWGPLQGEWITISYGMGHVFLVLRDSVGEVMQGAVTRFPMDFETGVMRGTFHPHDGQLYVAGLYGWAGNKTKAGGFYRVRFTGQPLRMVNGWHVAQDGLVLRFTDPLDPTSATDPGNFDVQAWNYRWSGQYGSPDFRMDGSEGRDRWRVEEAWLSEDRRTVFLRVPRIQRAMQVHVVFKLRAADGGSVDNFVHGTIHRTGSESGLARLGTNAVSRAQVGATELREEQPGLRLAFLGGTGVEPRDVRVSRLAALHVPVGTAVSAYAGVGPVRCRWEGYLKAELNDDRTTFAVEGRGRVRLRINEAEVLVEGGPSLGRAWSGAVALRRGLNRLEMEYEGPSEGDAEVRLWWSGAGHPPEPVPPTVLVHEGDDGWLRRFGELRRGRDLFAERQCGRCHRPEAGWGSTAMPDLEAGGPSFEGVGDRWQAGWVGAWLREPGRHRADERVPMHAWGAVDDTEARDIEAYLATLGSGARRGVEAGRVDPVRVEEGERRYRELSCAGCHVLSGEPGLTPETRISLAQVSAKWRPAALEEFLRAPARHHAWTRMPDFQLGEEEARALASLLWVRTEGARVGTGEPGGGDGRRGRDLVETRGCLRCHAVPGGVDRSRPPGLASIVRGDGQRGCLAVSEEDRGRAPRYELGAGERGALRVFLANEPERALGADSPVEFVTRQYDALRCAGCHARDLGTDVLSAVESGQRAAVEDEEGGGSVHVGRPPLTYAGEKLQADWTRRFLEGNLGYKPRSDMQGRMPAFAAYAGGLAAGMAQEHGYGVGREERLEVDEGLAEVGGALTRVEGGFSCVSCHGVGDRPALAGKDTATVNFAFVADRLRRSYYWRYVQDPPRVMPGTMMPKFIGDDGRTSIKTVWEGDPKRQFEAIWHYLHRVRAVP